MNGTTKQIEFANTLIARNAKRFDAMRAAVKTQVEAMTDCPADDAAKTIAFAGVVLDDIATIIASDDAAAIIDALTGMDSKTWGSCYPKLIDADRLIGTAFAILDGDKKVAFPADFARFARI